MTHTREIQKATGAEHLGVYPKQHMVALKTEVLKHTAVLHKKVLKGAFKDDAGTKKEFMDNIKLQQEFASGK